MFGAINPDSTTLAVRALSFYPAAMALVVNEQ